jgi:lysophospholipase L1-like esterase
VADIAVSLYLPGPTGQPTVHPSAHQTSYLARGDVSSRDTLPDAKTTDSYYFLTGVDVQGQDIRGSVVTLGASITEGYSSTHGTNRSWPSVLAARLADEGLKIAVLNQGIGGNRLLSDGAGQSALKRFDRDVLSQPGLKWVIFSDDPINDLGSTYPPPTAEELIAVMRRLIARAHEKHIQFLCSTLTPYEGANYWTPSGEAAREQINALLRSGKSGCDAVIDQDTATHDLAHPTRYLPAYDSGDHLHPNDAGHRAVANDIDLLVFRQWRNER